MTSLNRWYYFVAFFVLSILIKHFINFYSQYLFNLETSVWCHKDSNHANYCKFKNICYDPQFKTFLYFLSENSIIKGIDTYSDLQKIELSSLQHHNQFYANLSVIDIKNYRLTKNLKIHSKAILMSRFKPNNIMHSIHDDLFPLYLTLEDICLGDLKCIEIYSLVFHDSHPTGPFFYFYELLSKNSPVILDEVVSNSELFCFKEMHTGLVKDSIVYQYGFNKPHGPVESRLTQADILRFTLFVKSKLKIEDELNNLVKIVLLSRQKNRKILNIEEVKEMIENVYEKLNKKVYVTIINLNLFSNDVKALLKIISNADGIIGVHGAEMILSLFLKPKSFVLELFPFGINPEIVSFIKPISKINGCHFSYFSWKNTMRNHSISHPESLPMFGGISHLDEMTQMKIKNMEEVPAVECCNNPLFLYHMYQDTIVSNSFEDYLYKLLNNHENLNLDANKWFHPYVVSNFSCIFLRHRNLLDLRWKSPFNVNDNDDLSYSLYIKDKKGVFRKDIITEKTKLEVEVLGEVESKFEVWIYAYFRKNNFRSRDLYMNCY